MPPSSHSRKGIDPESSVSGRSTEPRSIEFGSPKKMRATEPAPMKSKGTLDEKADQHNSGMELPDAVAGVCREARPGRGRSLAQVACPRHRRCPRTRLDEGRGCPPHGRAGRHLQPVDERQLSRPSRQRERQREQLARRLGRERQHCNPPARIAEVHSHGDRLRDLQRPALFADHGRLHDGGTALRLGQDDSRPPFRSDPAALLDGDRQPAHQDRPRRARRAGDRTGRT